MAMAAANCYFSVLTSSTVSTSRCSLTSQCLFSTFRRPTYFLTSIVKSSKDRNQNPKQKLPRKKPGKFSKESEAITQKFPGISKDESLLSNADGQSSGKKSGRSRSTLFRSSGMQRKGSEGLLFDSKDQQGVLVRNVEPTSDASNVLKKGDVIVSFDGVRVGCEGTVPFQTTERIAFRFLISQKFAGDVAELGVIRGGQFMKVQAITNPHVHLVPYHIEGGQPSYLIVAGMVFTPLSEPLIEEECEDTIGLKLLTKVRYSLARFKGEQIVNLSQVLANEVNIGYEDMSNEQVLKLNGTWIRNIHHLAHLVDSCKDKYLIFEFEDNFLVVLEREAALAASGGILKYYGIPSERSSDLSEPYVDSIGHVETINQHESVDRAILDSEFGYDGLLWA